MSDRIWLSHHPPSELNRCFRVGGLHICARCLGLWPALLLAVAAEAVHPVPAPLSVRLAAEIGLCLPGLWDIQRGAADPASGSNAYRFWSGAALGLALGHAATVGRAYGFAAPDAVLPLALCVAFGLWALVVRGDRASS